MRKYRSRFGGMTFLIQLLLWMLVADSAWAVCGQAEIDKVCKAPDAAAMPVGTDTKTMTDAAAAGSAEAARVSRETADTCRKNINPICNKCPTPAEKKQCQDYGWKKAQKADGAANAAGAHSPKAGESGESQKGEAGKPPEMPKPGEGKPPEEQQPQQAKKKPLTCEELAKKGRSDPEAEKAFAPGGKCRSGGSAGTINDGADALVPFLSAAFDEEPSSDRDPASLGSFGYEAVPDNQYNTLGKDAKIVKKEALGKTDGQYATTRVAYFRDMGMANDLEEELTTKISQGEDLCTVYQQVEVLKGSFYPEERKMGDRLEEMLWPAVVNKGFSGDEEGLQIYCTMVL